MKKNWIFFAPLAIVAFVLFIALGGYVVMLLWNWLLPPLFGWSQIAFWQALGILALSRILFGSFGMHGRGYGRRYRKWDHDDKGPGLREWMNMTPEEREKFREGLKASGTQAS